MPAVLAKINMLLHINYTQGYASIHSLSGPISGPAVSPWAIPLEYPLSLQLVCNHDSQPLVKITWCTYMYSHNSAPLLIPEVGTVDG